jgi:hypothetical protein
MKRKSISTIPPGDQEHLQVAEIAAAVAVTGLTALALFQVALASGLQFGHAAWGGASAHLTSAQRIGSAASVAVYAAAVAVILARLGLSRWPRAHWLLSWFPWFLAVLLALGALANFGSQSPWENYLLGPAAAVLAVACVIVARSPITSR